MSTQSQCELMTVQQVAELLQVPVPWVYGRLRKRSLEKLPGYRLGKYWRFDREQVLAWLAQQREGRKAA
jgi:excisionase family DNA binding protein